MYMKGSSSNEAFQVAQSKWSRAIEVEQGDDKWLNISYVEVIQAKSFSE